MLHKSLSIIRTNPTLTANVKVVVTSDYKLFLESYNANTTLSDTRFKHFRINKEDFLFVRIPEFFKNVPNNIAFESKFDNDQTVMFDTYDNQYDTTYWAGCSNIEDTWHQEEFECIAPLYVNPKKIPSNFIILRIDGPGIINLNATNFKSEILDKWKCVKVFDLGLTSDLGTFLDRNFNYKYFPKNGLEINFKKFEFSRWKGIEYVNGGLCDKSSFLTQTFNSEQPFYELEKFITDGYNKNNVINPFLINLKFLFDDTPATPTSLKKYSINRYMGFYTDTMSLISNLSCYEPVKLITGKTIINNVFFDGGHYDPIQGGWRDTKTYYVYLNNDFHLITRTKLNTGLYEYKIISDQLFNTLTDTFNKVSNASVFNSLIRIKYNTTTLRNEITLSDGSSFNNALNYNLSFSKSHLNLLKIEDSYHVVNYDIVNNVYYLQTDYAIQADPLVLRYYINNLDPNYTFKKSVSSVDSNNKPIIFSLYRVEFTEIVDFDNDLINTDYAEFEYDEATNVPSTAELKMYATDQSGNAQPKILLTDIPTTSEYIADSELFAIKGENLLSDIWRKNEIFVKWGYAGSVSHSDQPYKLNNNVTNANQFNRTGSPFNIVADRIDANLDWFYTISPPAGNYINHSLHIEETQFKPSNIITSNYDFFDAVFKFKQTLDGGNIVRNVYKYSVFNNPSNNEPYDLLHRGLKLQLLDMLNIKRDAFNKITDITVGQKNDYSNYKFSAVFAAKLEKIDSGSFVPVTITDPEYKKSGIDIYVNRRYKNILMHIYIYDTIALSGVNSNFRDTLYTQTNIAGSTLNANDLTIANIIHLLNDVNNNYNFDYGIRYWEIKEDGSFDYNQNYNSSTYGQFNLSPAYLMATYPEEVAVKKDSIFVQPYQGPDFPLNQPKIIGVNQPLAVQLFFNNTQPSRVSDLYNLSSSIPLQNFTTIAETNDVSTQGILSFEDKIYRYSGPYAPIFKTIQAFKTFSNTLPLPPYESGNYLFDMSLTNFGISTEQKFSKVNPTGSQLRLRKNTRFRSVYPMVGEFGYEYADIFTFKSSWDEQYFYTTINNGNNIPN